MSGPESEVGLGALARVGHSPEESVGAAGRDHDLGQESVQKEQSALGSSQVHNAASQMPHIHNQNTTLGSSPNLGSPLFFYFSVNGTTNHPITATKNLKVFLDSLVNFSTPQ